jgi:hypothetical protein
MTGRVPLINLETGKQERDHVKTLMI